jgi:hypothetical protein
MSAELIGLLKLKIQLKLTSEFEHKKQEERKEERNNSAPVSVLKK